VAENILERNGITSLKHASILINGIVFAQEFPAFTLNRRGCLRINFIRIFLCNPFNKGAKGAIVRDMHWRMSKYFDVESQIFTYLLAFLDRSREIGIVSFLKFKPGSIASRFEVPGFETLMSNGRRKQVRVRVRSFFVMYCGPG